MSDKYKDILPRLAQLKNKRSLFDPLFQETIDYDVQSTGLSIYIDEFRGNIENDHLFDSTVSDAKNILNSGLHTQLTSASSPWFGLMPAEMNLRDNHEARDWLDQAERIMYESYAESNFYKAMPEFYSSLTQFGLGSQYIDADMNPFKLFFINSFMGGVYVAENKYGEVDTKYFEHEWTVRQVVQEFGLENVSTETKKLYDENQYDTNINVLHVVQPRIERNRAMKTADNKPFASIYGEISNASSGKELHVLRDSGYEEFPYVTGRWDVKNNEVYARSPFMQAMLEIKSVNEMDKTNMQAGHLAVKPPLNVPPKMKGKIRNYPGGLNYIPGKDGITPIYTGANGIPMSEALLARKQEAIREKFFVRVFLMLDAAKEGQYVNREHVEQLKQEKMMVLGSVVGSLMDSVLGPNIRRVFRLHVKGDMFPPLPESLVDQQLKIEYTSPLAKVQKAIEGAGVRQAFEFLMPWIERVPDMIDNVNTDELPAYAFDINGAPVKLLNSPETVIEIREQRAEAAAAEAQKQDTQQGAETMKTLAQADQASGGKMSEELDSQEGEAING